jgi:hypothetical protein
MTFVPRGLLHSRRMFFTEKYVNCNLRPTEVTEFYWLFEHRAEIVEKYPLADGKWMQFYNISELDTMWDFAKTEYRAGRLEGIASMKVSTSCEQPRASTSSQGVIIFFCGPSDNEEKMMQFGLKLLEAMPLNTSSRWMSYKSNEQTFAGTRATGQTKNYLYRLPCAKN